MKDSHTSPSPLNAHSAGSPEEDRSGLRRALDSLASTSFVVLPVNTTCRVIEPGRSVRRKEVRHGTRGRRGSRHVPPCPMRMLTVDRPVASRVDLDRLDVALAPHGYQIDRDHYAGRWT
jgi:hypothetical protein